MGNKIRILHLSDLHIPENVKEDNEFKSVKQRLMADISSQKKKFGDINIIVFTGDIVNKGHSELFETEELKKFFEDIIRQAGADKENVLLVPGNHDASRPDASDIVDKYITSVRTEQKITEKPEEVRFLCGRFERFTKFHTQIIGDESIKNSYGVRDIVIQDQVYRFILLNSSIGTRDSDDYGNLFITKVQLDEIVNSFNDQVAPQLTFVLMHHPMEWLCYDERNLLNEYIADDTKFKADIVLNGHIHTGQISLASDLDTNIITLVSGVGYTRGKKGESAIKTSQYRYAIYEIDMQKNFLHGILRATNNKKVFTADTTLYTKINHDGEFCIPIKLDYDLMTQSINVPLKSQVALSSALVGEIKNIVEAIHDLGINVKQFVDDSVKRKRKGVSTEEKLEGVLFKICTHFRSMLFKDIKEGDIRIHFRHYFEDLETNQKEHRVIMSVYGEQKDKNFVTSIPWQETNNLIYYSYTNNRTLIQSLNKEKAYNNPESQWDDFLTLAISYMGFKEKKIPAMSFGISFKYKNLQPDQQEHIQNILYALSFVGLEQVMQNIIEYASAKIKFKEADIEKLGGFYSSESDTK